MIYRKAFTITGIANQEVFDTGVISSEAEKKKITALVLFVTGQIANIINAYVEREKVFSVYDFHIDTDESTGSTNVQKGVVKQAVFDIGKELEMGHTFKASISCGGTLKTVYGYYEYELI